MSNFKIFDRLSNLLVVNGQLQISTSKSANLRIGDSITNAYVDGTGALYVIAGGTPAKVMTIDDEKTNIALDANNAVCINDTLSETYKTAIIYGSTTNIPLDINGRLMVNDAGAGTIGIKINGIGTNAVQASGGGIYINTLGALNNILLETGDDLLQEIGDKILLEN